VVDGGILALLELKDAADRVMAERGWESRLTVKAHFGPVVAGQSAWRRTSGTMFSGRP